VTLCGLMGVPVELEPTLTPGAPARIVAGRYYHGGPYRSYDVSPDGRRFLMMREGDVAGESAPAAAPF
jgi:hypothetical protein